MDGAENEKSEDSTSLFVWFRLCLLVHGAAELDASRPSKHTDESVNPNVHPTCIWNRAERVWRKNRVQW